MVNPTGEIQISVVHLSWIMIGFITISIFSAAIVIFSCADGASRDESSDNHVDHVAGAGCAGGCGAACGA